MSRNFVAVFFLINTAWNLVKRTPSLTPTQTPGVVIYKSPYLLQPLLHLFYSDPGNGPWKRKADAAFQHCKVCKIFQKRIGSSYIVQWILMECIACFATSSQQCMMDFSLCFYFYPILENKNWGIKISPFLSTNLEIFHLHLTLTSPPSKFLVT